MSARRRAWPVAVLATAAVVHAGAASAGPRPPSGTVQPPPDACWAARVQRADAYAAGRAGVTAFVVQDVDGRSFGVRTAQAFRTASLLKALLMVAYLRRADVRGRALRADERALLEPMIRRSDDEAATALLDRLGREQVERTARAAGMRDFRLVLGIWGLSQTSARDQARFYRRLDLLLPRRHRAYARSLLLRIVPEQRWGLPHALPAGWQLRFKGGWGSGTGRVTSQAGRLERGRDFLSIAVMTEFDPSLAYGAETIAGIAARLLLPQPCGR